MVHQEADSIAVFSAAKTMKKLFCAADCKTGRFFTVKGAQAHEIGAAFFELDIATHNLHNIDAGE